MTTLTRTQRRVLAAIQEHLEQMGYAPSYRELQMAIGVNSASTITRAVDALAEKGFIARNPGRGRSIDVLRETRTPEERRQRALEALSVLYCDYLETKGIPEDAIPGIASDLAVLGVKYVEEMWNA